MSVSLLLLNLPPLKLPYGVRITLNFWLKFGSETACRYCFITVFSCDHILTIIGQKWANLMFYYLMSRAGIGNK